MLHALAGDRARLALRRFQLVDLVDEDDAVLRGRDVAVGLVYEPLEHRVELFVDEPRLRERGRVGSDERHLDEFGKGLAHERLAGAGRADQHDVAFRDLDLALARLVDLAVVRIDRDREGLLRLVLADDEVVEIADDRTGLDAFV